MTEGIREALIIFNALAGRARRARRLLERAQKALARGGIESEIAFIDGEGSGAELARQAVRQGRQLVITCGGDGTLNEVANGLAKSQVPLAVLPAGTGNILAKELSLPWNIEKAAALVARSTLRRIALGFVTTEKTSQTGRYFLSVGGAGLDGAIVRGINAELKKRTGTLAFWAEGARQMASYKFPRFRTTVDGKTIDGTLVVIGRTKHYGGPIQITTRADLYGNDFELMICTTRSRWAYLGYVGMLLAGQLRRARSAHFCRATSVQFEPVDAEPVWFQVDGELMGHLPAEFRVVPDALTLAVPDAMR
jgi:diacylglycerol kinase (ATP)